MASRCRGLDIELMGVPCCLALYFSPSLLATVTLASIGMQNYLMLNQTRGPRPIEPFLYTGVN